uniref:Uncharacterized protein n=1 Tax=Arundo donax TaxID=35708 RepID=A0A0A9GYS5_ARUDO
MLLSCNLRVSILFYLPLSQKDYSICYFWQLLKTKHFF